jgi:hypothetical protein
LRCVGLLWRADFGDEDAIGVAVVNNNLLAKMSRRLEWPCLLDAAEMLHVHWGVSRRGGDVTCEAPTFC